MPPVMTKVAPVPPSRSLASAFASDERGSVAIMFGLCAVALLLSVGLAVDMGIALNARTKLSQAIDVAVLSAAKSARVNNLTKDQTIAVAQTYIDAVARDLDREFSTLNPAEITVDDNVSKIDIRLSAVYQTRFGNLVGMPTFDIEAIGAGRIDGNDVEIGMQLDVTGSMNQTQGGQVKIVALRDAAKNAIDTLIPDVPGPHKVRVGIAPFSAGVNAGPYAQNVNGNRLGVCTYERKALADQTTDVAPAGLDVLKIKSDLPPPPAGKSLQDCPTAPVIGLSSDKAALKNAIDALNAGGSTAGHLGAAWSWYLIAPTWAGVWGGDPPAPYNDGKTLKFAVMMTDGIYNTVNGVSYDDADLQSDNYARPTCDAMKAKGIVIYTIAFGDASTISAKAETTLKSCASGANKYFLATDPAKLNAAFTAIAQDITSLRLTK